MATDSSVPLFLTENLRLSPSVVLMGQMTRWSQSSYHTLLSWEISSNQQAWLLEEEMCCGTSALRVLTSNPSETRPVLFPSRLLLLWYFAPNSRSWHHAELCLLSFSFLHLLSSFRLWTPELNVSFGFWLRFVLVWNRAEQWWKDVRHACYISILWFVFSAQWLYFETLKLKQFHSCDF